MEERRLNLKQIIITALVTGIVAFGTTMFIDYIRKRELQLVYYVEDTLPFKSPTKNFAIYHVKIENNGKRIVSNVICHLSYATANIEQHRIIAEPSIAYKDYIFENSYRVEFPNLNPQESVIISILASSSEDLANRPKVSLRGEGIIGIEASRKTEINQKELMKGIPTTLIAIMAAYTGLFSVLIMRKKLFKRLSGEIGPKHSDDQKLILAYLCGLHGLSEDVDRYLNISTDVYYWSESDRLAILVIENPSGEKANKIKKVLEDLLTYAPVSPASEGIVHYNIAKIAKAQGNDEESNDHLNKAKKLIPKLINTRIKIDPIFIKTNINDIKK